MSIRNDYFEWLLEIINAESETSSHSYLQLLHHLHTTDFVPMLARDRNRAADGIALRRRFSSEDSDFGSCSIFEMMVALAIRMENDIMDDPDIGYRVDEWFWSMVINLGLGGMHDASYDEEYVTFVLNRFLDRQYRPDGKGGLFWIRDSEQDLREVEIWDQMCWYLDKILGL